MPQRTDFHANHVHLDCGEENAKKFVIASITRGRTLIKKCTYDYLYHFIKPLNVFKAKLSLNIINVSFSFSVSSIFFHQYAFSERSLVQQSGHLFKNSLHRKSINILLNCLYIFVMHYYLKRSGRNQTFIQTLKSRKKR